MVITKMIMTISEAKHNYDLLTEKVVKAEKSLGEYTAHIKETSVQILKDMYGLECYVTVNAPNRWDSYLELIFSSSSSDQWGEFRLFRIQIKKGGTLNFHLSKTISADLSEEEIISFTTILLDLKKSKGIFSVVGEYYDNFTNLSDVLVTLRRECNDAQYNYRRLQRDNAESEFYNNLSEGDTLDGFYIERITEKNVIGISYGWQRWEDCSYPKRRRVKKSDFYETYRHYFNEYSN